MSRRALFIITILLSPCWLATSASAGGGFGLGGRYALVNNRHTDETTQMGGIVARARSEFIGVEGAVDYRKQDLNGDVDLKTWPVTFSFLVFPIRTVYGLVGLGWYNSTIDFPSDSPYGDRTESRAGYHFGAGLEIPVAPTLRLTGDFRYQFIGRGFDEIPSSIGEVDEDAFTLNVGLLFYPH